MDVQEILENGITVYTGTSWKWMKIPDAGVSLSLSGYTASKNFDIFGYDNSGSLAIESLIWTNDANRATALVLQDGVLVKSGATTRRYLGTMRTTGTTGQSEDSLSRRFVWNYYNRKLAKLYCSDPTSTWTYTLSTWRSANANTVEGQGRVGGVIGVCEDISYITRLGEGRNSIAGYGATISIGIDSATVSSSDLLHTATVINNNCLIVMNAYLITKLSAGYHYIQSLEQADAGGVFTWYGTISSIITGLIGEIYA